MSVVLLLFLSLVYFFPCDSLGSMFFLVNKQSNRRENDLKLGIMYFHLFPLYMGGGGGGEKEIPESTLLLTGRGMYCK